MIKLATLKGYVLEEAIARLLAKNGYRLLTDEQQDPEALTHGPHGLLVRGRGSDHQADALGDLLIPVPFSLPVRLFVEAKYRGDSVGLSDVRNALGVLADVNEQYATASGSAGSRPVRRFHYRYSLFSTSGFSPAAEAFALAQQISLIDLQGPAFLELRDLVTSVAEQVLALANQEQLSSMPIGQVRTALRLALGTWTGLTGGGWGPDQATALNPASSEGHQLPTRPMSAIARDFAAELHEDMVLGFPMAPFILALRPDDVDAFYTWTQSQPPEVHVNIRFAVRGEVAGDWVIVPVSGGPLLRFGLPPALSNWLLAVDGAEADRAMMAKRQLLSTITLFVGSRTLTLRFTPRPRRESARSTDLTEDAQLREELADPSLAFRATPSDPAPRLLPEERWTSGAAAELLRRLDDEGWAQAKVLRAAGRTDGRVERATVYELAKFPEDRSLNGFTRPVRRIARQLLQEGILTNEPPVALRPHYVQGGKASFFTVPEDLLYHLRRL